MASLDDLLVFALGSCIGSFLNVVVYRLPRRQSLLWPASRCPVCRHPLGPLDNVPILAWLWLRGQCRYCNVPISGRYPLVEFLTGLLFVAVWSVWGMSVASLSGWILVGWLIPLALIDLDTFTLPNVLTRSGVVIGLVLSVVTAIALDQPIIPTLVGRLGAAVLGLWLFTLMSWAGALLLGQPAMGGGDGKLAAMLGAWLGWQGLLLSLFLACLGGATLGGGAIALGKLKRRQAMPFGPFLVLGALASLFWGTNLIAGYRTLMGI
jgi:leader peptidase (prepilin peptidase) / N-methyltransferase